jgi:hypothetical protein
LHHSFLSFPNGSDAQILNDFQKHQTVFVSIYPTTGEGLTLRESPATRRRFRGLSGKSEHCRRKAIPSLNLPIAIGWGIGFPLDAKTNKDQLSRERRKQLDELGFVWNVTAGTLRRKQQCRNFAAIQLTLQFDAPQNLPRKREFWTLNCSW